MTLASKLDRPRSLTDLAVERIRAAIVEGDLAFGEQLSEAALALKLGISKTPVREALLRLKMDGLVDKARFTEDPAEYEATVKAFIALCMREVPVVPLNQPIHDVALKQGVGGYEFWFHREPDYRQLTKT